MAQVSLVDVTKSYPGDIQAVKPFSLGIERGEFIVLVGPSGCGKTTLLRMIAGLEEITSGKVFIGDKLVNDMPPKDRNIAMVFQNYALYPHMSVFDNMAFGLKLRRYPRPEIETRVREAAEILGIGELLHRKPKELSGGQRQRVAVGRAIVRKPLVFLFDEPLSNLDAKMRVQMRLEINRLHNRLKTTMIYVTHDQTEAMTMGDRIVVMDKGVIQQVARPQELYNRPANRFVAGFIGSPPMNFIKGKIARGPAGDLVFQNGSSFRVMVAPVHREKVGGYLEKPVLFGIRPEDIYDKLFVPDPNPRNMIRALCEVVEPMGSEAHLYLRCGESTFTAKVSGYVDPEANQDIDVVIDMNKAHFFDVETEKTIV
jgi:multiple sugar transport system ATP-binding protein